MNKLTKLSKISYVIDILQQAREKLLEATTIINTDKRDEVMETITSAIDEVYTLLEMEGQVKWIKVKAMVINWQNDLWIAKTFLRFLKT